MIKDIKMRLVALIEESYYSQNDKVFKVINFLPDIKVEKVIENGIHKQDNGIYYFDINKEQDPVQIPYTNNIKDLSVIIGQNGSGKTMTINKILREDNRETLVHLIFERNGSLYTYPNFKQESISFKQSNIHPYIIKFSNAKEFSNNDKPIRPGAIDASDFKNILLFNNSVLKSNEEKIIFLQETINQIKFIEEFKYKINQFVDYTTKGITVNFQSNNLAYNTNQLVFVDSMEKSNAEQNPINTRIVDYFSALINHITDNYSTNIKIKDIEKLLDHHLSLWNDNFNNQNNQNLQRALSEIIEYPYNTYSIYDIKILYSLFIFHIYSYYIKNNNGQYNKYKNKLISIIKENRTIYGNNLNKREINKKLLNRYFESKNAINYLDVSLYNLESITPNAEYFTKWENIWRQIEKQCITVAKAVTYISYFNLYKCESSIKYTLDNQKVWNDLLSFGVPNEEIEQLKKFEKLLLELKENTTDFESLSSVVNCVSKIRIPEVIQSIQMSWKGLSSGELGLLKSFANLYLAKQSIERKTAQGVQRKNLLLLLDEIDLGLHPEWQRKWVSTALPIIEKIFEDKHLQIIITSHSPIFLSDIYKENIIFLTKENEREKEKIFEKTFGQNIYTLFKNSFFLQDVMGEYAYNTIKDTIEFLTLKINPTDRSLDSNSLFNRLDETKRKKTAKKIIDSVGEPIIANQLKELFYKAFPNKNDEISEIQNKIYQLQNRIRQLEEERSQ
jgi:hypothetical protein